MGQPTKASVIPLSRKTLVFGVQIPERNLGKLENPAEPESVWRVPCYGSLPHGSLRRLPVGHSTAPTWGRSPSPSAFIGFDENGLTTRPTPIGKPWTTFALFALAAAIARLLA